MAVTAHRELPIHYDLVVNTDVVSPDVSASSYNVGR
jgi:hypothetical protein